MWGWSAQRVARIRIDRRGRHQHDSSTFVLRSLDAKDASSESACGCVLYDPSTCRPAPAPRTLLVPLPRSTASFVLLLSMFPTAADTRSGSHGRQTHLLESHSP